jgi:phenylalanyl-tRNA synthetase beta chain
MIFSYNWLQEYLKQRLPEPNKLAKVLSDHFTEVEEVIKTGKDFVLDIDVKPNRAGDCFSHWGIARECSAILDYELRLPEIKIKEDKSLKTKDLIKIEVKDKKACPRYTARVVSGVQVGPSPEWLKQRLEVCGLQSINNIVDIANYVMLETGQPLHTFDLDKLKGQTLIVRFARKDESIVTLDDKDFELDQDILVIADQKDPVAIAGIKGGKEPGIDETTKTIVLESANFDRLVIRKGSQKLKLRTDASWRFENGIDPNLTEIAINRAAGLIQELANGKVAQGLVDFYPDKVKPLRVELEYSRIKGLLGIEIPKNQSLDILKRLSFEILSDEKGKILVEVPTLRLDVSIGEDLIEEIGRIYGYEKIPALPPKALMVPPSKNLEVFWEEFSKDVLKESGFNEVYNYSFVDEAKLELYGFDKAVEVENPVSESYKYLCPSLIPNLLENVVQNFRFFDEVRIFELNKVFQMKGKGVKEKRALTGLIAAKRKKDLFFQLKGVIESLLEKMGIAECWFDDYQPTPELSKAKIWNLGKSAEIKVDEQEIGFLGELSSVLIDKLKISGRVVVFDLDFEKLQKLASEEQEYQVFSPYPSAIRDLAVLVPFGTKVVEVLNLINEVAGSLLRDVDLFDVYEGEELPQGKKNLAFHLVYQAQDRTLDSKEIEKLHNKIIEALEQNPEWEVRK